MRCRHQSQHTKHFEWPDRHEAEPMWNVVLVLPDGRNILHSKGLTHTEAIDLSLEANQRAIQYGTKGFYKTQRNVPDLRHTVWHIPTWFVLMTEYDDVGANHPAFRRHGDQVVA